MQQKPHILFLANHYRGPGRSGGARTWHQARELVQKFHVTLIIPHIDPLTKEYLIAEELPLFRGMSIQLAYCHLGSRKSLLGRIVYQGSGALVTFYKALRTERPDIVLAMGAPPASALVGLLIAMIKRVPILLDVRDIPLETAEELGFLKQTWMLRVTKWIESTIFRRVDRIVCVSDEMADFVRARGVPYERIFANYIGYDNFDNKPIFTGQLRRQLLEGLDEATTLVAFYAGTLASLVDIPTILRAAENVKKNRKIGFVIVGDGERKELYVKWVLKRGLNVHFSGRVPKSRVHELCAAADICVYPLIGGPATGAMLGNKVFDYLGAGKPIIYTGPDGAVARLINRLGAGLVFSAEDDKGLVQALKELNENSDKFLKMGSTGQKIVLEKMTAAHSAHDLAEKLSELLKNSKHLFYKN